MYFHWFLKLADICIDTFDLVNEILLVLCEYPVSSAFYHDTYIIIFRRIFKRNFCPVMTSHLTLYLPVKSAAFQHRFFIRRASAVIKVTAS